MVMGYRILGYSAQPVGIGRIIVKIDIILILGNFARYVKYALTVMPFFELEHGIFITI